jgi:hypothetical protein
VELTDLSHGQGAPSDVARGPHVARARRVRRPGGAPQRVGPASAAGHPPADRARAGVPDAADHLQADYFLRLLNQSRRLIDQRIDEYRKAIAAAEANGDADGARGFERVSLAEQRDRQAVDGMIDRLRRRFPRPPRI